MKRLRNDSAQATEHPLHQINDARCASSRMRHEFLDENHSLLELKKRICIVENVFTQDQCRELMHIHDGHRHEGYIHHLTVTRVADLTQTTNLTSLAVVLPLLCARYQIWQCAETYLDETLSLYPEFTALMAWHEGSHLKTHFDANRDYLSDRHYSAILYLNDSTEFDGGDLVFELSAGNDCDPTAKEVSSTIQEFRVTPQAGRLVCFPSHSQYRHRVDEITQGSRYTLVMWLTKTEEAMETLEQSLQRHLRNIISLELGDKDTWTSLVLETSLRCLAQLKQPWETAKQAKMLVKETMTGAKFVWMEEKKRWCLPHHLTMDDKLEPRNVNQSLFSPSKKDNSNNNGISSLLNNTSIMLQLIAYCRWKRGGQSLGMMPLDDVWHLVEEWLQYTQRLFWGLQRAALRWIEHGMITDVTNEEMMMRLSGKTNNGAENVQG